MTDSARTHSAGEVVRPPAIELAELAPWAAFALALVALIGLVSFGPESVLHEVLHDGRHLLAFPCD